MYVNQYQHEHQVKTIIATYHHDAVKAEKIRLVHTGPGQRTRAIKNLRTSVRSLLATASGYGQPSVSRPALVNTPSDEAFIA